MEFILKHKKKIAVFVICGVIYAACLFLGIEVDISDLLSGDVVDLAEDLDAGTAEPVDVVQ